MSNLLCKKHRIVKGLRYNKQEEDPDDFIQLGEFFCMGCEIEESQQNQQQGISKEEFIQILNELSEKMHAKGETATLGTGEVKHLPNLQLPKNSSNNNNTTKGNSKRNA